MIERRKRSSLLERARAAFRVNSIQGQRKCLVFASTFRRRGRRLSVTWLERSRAKRASGYSEPAYAADPEAPAISAFPDKGRTYRSKDLWPFFFVRLPPLERQDIKEIVNREGLVEKDTLRLLALLSRRAVTSPYEFELQPQGT